MIIVNIAIFLAMLGLLFYFQKIHFTFNKRIFIALISGGILGVLMQVVYTPELIHQTLNIYNLVSVGYVRLLQMLIYPIVVISILSAMTKMGEQTKIGRSISYIIGTLLLTTAIAALIGILVTLAFHLNLNSLSQMTADPGILSQITSKGSPLDKPFYQIVTDFITPNPFSDLAGSRSNSIASLVIFFILVGFAYLGVKEKEPLYAEKFKTGVDVLNKILMRLVTLVLRLTPYGIFALFCKITATCKLVDILSLINFILVSYISILIMFLVHSLLLAIWGFNLIAYYKKTISLFIFAFTSRSSAAAIPFNIEVQTKRLGVSESIASTGASFGAVLGQNGCAGIYPAMLAVCIAPSVGIDPSSFQFIVSLIAVVTVSSFGIAGVGGGATFAAIVVLSTFNMPLTLVALLIGVEPIIDMARTALNVSGSVTASLITAKITGEVKMDIFNNQDYDSEEALSGQNHPIL